MSLSVNATFHLLSQQLINVEAKKYFILSNHTVDFYYRVIIFDLEIKTERMTAPLQHKMVSAFTMGYFTSYLKEFLNEKKTMLNDFKRSFFVEHGYEIKDTISKLYEDVFEKKFSQTFPQDCIDEIKTSIDTVINSTSEEISKREEPFLEFAFLSGSFLSVADTILIDEINREEFEGIYGELISSLDLNIAWSELEKLMCGLSSGSKNKKCNSRDELFLMISKNNSTAKKIYDFQYLLDKLSLHRVFEHLSDVGMYLSSFMLLFSMS